MPPPVTFAQNWDERLDCGWMDGHVIVHGPRTAAAFNVLCVVDAAMALPVAAALDQWCFLTAETDNCYLKELILIYLAFLYYNKG